MRAPTGLLTDPTRVLFFTGKGGMGKTTLACATAVALARAGRRVLLVSTDPASNLDEVLETPLGEEPCPVTGAPRLEAANVDPEAAAAAYRERAVGPYRGVLPDSAIASMEESLSGACTLEIAAFDVFARLLGDPQATAGYDHVIFDTAPTGHTLRLLTLPAAWTDFMDANTTGTSCLGPLAGLSAQRDLYAAGVQALCDGRLTTLVLVSRPEPGALDEAARACLELAAAGMRHQVLALNGLLEDAGDDALAEQLLAGQQAALAGMPAALEALEQVQVPLSGHAAIGPDALAAVLDPTREVPAITDPRTSTPDGSSLDELLDALERAGHGVVMTMGKGGVGKTTMAAALATELARRGHRVRLSTTDPAAHVAQVAGAATSDLQVSRIDPHVEVAAYTEHVLATAGADLDEQGRALLHEDLRSPCTEEIAVFQAFARTVAEGQDAFVILDTAPTGHTLLLLDAAETYHRAVARGSGSVPAAVRELLPHLRDPERTHVVLVTLPEATPVHEAARLAADLRRAGIDPQATIVNQSLAAARTEHPVLAARAAREQRYIAEAAELCERTVVVPWRAGELTGPELFQSLAA